MTLRTNTPGTTTVSSSERPTPPARLALRATARGCALIGPRGEVVFYADGARGRRECLEFARERGVLALSS